MNLIRDGCLTVTGDEFKGKAQGQVPTGIGYFRRDTYGFTAIGTDFVLHGPQPNPPGLQSPAPRGRTTLHPRLHVRARPVAATPPTPAAVPAPGHRTAPRLVPVRVRCDRSCGRPAGNSSWPENSSGERTTPVRCPVRRSYSQHDQRRCRLLLSFLRASPGRRRGPAHALRIRPGARRSPAVRPPSAVPASPDASMPNGARQEGMPHPSRASLPGEAVGPPGGVARRPAAPRPSPRPAPGQPVSACPPAAAYGPLRSPPGRRPAPLFLPGGRRPPYGPPQGPRSTRVPLLRPGTGNGPVASCRQFAGYRERNPSGFRRPVKDGPPVGNSRHIVNTARTPRQGWPLYRRFMPHR